MMNGFLFQFIALVIAGTAIGIGVGITWGVLIALNNVWHHFRKWQGARINRRRNARRWRTSL